MLEHSEEYIEPIKNISESNQIDSDIYELNNAEIVSDVIASKEKFTWEELQDFSSAIEQTLISRQLGEIIQRNESTQHYFDNYLNYRIPEQRQIMVDKNLGPIPEFYVLPCKNTNELDLASSTEEYILKPADHYYPIYFSFKFRLIPINSLTPFLNYHLGKYFKDRTDYTSFLIGISADYSSVIGERRDILKQYVTNPENAYSAPLAESEYKESDETLDGNVHRQQVLAIKYLLDTLMDSKENEFEVPLTEVARFIIFLTGKNTGTKVGNSNTYKMLKQPLVSYEATNITNLRKIRRFFEGLGMTDIVDKINKEINSSN